MALAVTKLDTIADDSEREARFRHVCDRLRPFLKSIGLADALDRAVPVCAVEGGNVVRAPEPGSVLAWWKGPTFLDLVEGFELPGSSEPAALDALPLRLPLVDVQLRHGGKLLGVAGKIAQGGVRKGDVLLAAPANVRARVKEVVVDGQPWDAAGAGEHVQLVLGVAEESGGAVREEGESVEGTLLGVQPGAVLCPPQAPVIWGSRCRARVIVSDAPLPLLPGQDAAVYCQAATGEGRYGRLWKAALDGSLKPARFLTQGQQGEVEILLARPICFEPAGGSGLGRIALRDGGRTVAVGVVAEVSS
ncbi:hypothetical protein H632_c2424p0 [Helicosporidium sp. ATCC 50920]|nr:hypothetical protein H632_c2424p0 [Helicosporidium sp. ATCC 50920]|eukprot:KDD73210.1 hypothetical protein H632_c2424p0 [Helicosporidium sp. ATCC 50920]